MLFYSDAQNRSRQYTTEIKEAIIYALLKSFILFMGSTRIFE